jgi:apolipoprotein N-acyltransferase
MKIKKLGSVILAVSIMAIGALQTLSLSPFGYWVLGPLSLALFVIVTKALDHTTPLTKKRAFTQGWLLGFGLFASGASWIYVSINTYGYAHPVLAFALTLIFVAGLALFHGLFFFCFSVLRGKSSYLNAGVLAALWVLNDGLRTVFLTGFPWLFLGDGHLDSPLSGWVPIIGVYGVSAIVVATGAYLAASGTDLFSSESPGTKLKSLATFCLIAILWVAGYSLNNIRWTHEEKQNFEVALLQINIPQELKWRASQRPKTLELLAGMTRENWDKDIIFWPETAIPVLYDQAKPLLEHFATEASENDAAIVSGIPYRGWDSSENQSILHNSIVSIGDGRGINHKQKLVPFGEYVPLQSLLRGLIAFFDLPMSDFRKGPSDQPLLSTKGALAAAFICYEVVYPDFVASRAQNADYLITISNDSWFGTSIGPLQHLAMAQMRALENGKYMIRATNNGVSAIINDKGKIQNQTEQFVLATLQGNLKTMKGQTPFNRWGSWPIFMLCAAILAIRVFSLRIARTNGTTP